jgi:hypothetical protein
MLVYTPKANTHTSSRLKVPCSRALSDAAVDFESNRTAVRCLWNLVVARVMALGIATNGVGGGRSELKMAIHSSKGNIHLDSYRSAEIRWGARG